MMWSRTSTANTRQAPRSGVGDELAKRAASRREDIRKARRERLKFDRRRDEGIERGIREQIDRGGEPAGRCPARSMRWGYAADLTGDEAEAAAVKAATERRGDVLRSVPAQLEDTRLLAGKLECGRKPCGGSAGMNDEITIARGGFRCCKLRSERAGEAGARGLDVDQGNAGAGNASAQPCDQRAHDTRADDGNVIGRARRRIPHRVER